MVLFLPTAASAAVFTTSDGPISVQNWGYRLQGSGAEGGELLPAPLATAPHDMLVIDYARYGDEGSMFTQQEISDIKHSAPALGGDGHRKLLAGYLSIGEVSDFRSFWDPTWTDNGNANGNLVAGAPTWLGPINSDWPESRKVRYWDSDWQSIIFNESGTGWLDQIVDQGFDAAYLDIVDAYYYWGAEYVGAEIDDPANEKDAAQRMIDFIVDMGLHARQTNPDFMLIPQNASWILADLNDQDPTRKQAYLDAIAAIANEDVYYQGNKDENNSVNPERDDTRGRLTTDFLDNDVPVFVVDYLTNLSKIDIFISMAEADQFHPYVAPTRDLDILGSPISVPEPTLAPIVTLLLAIAGMFFLKRRSRSAV